MSEKERIDKILSKIKETVGNNNYQLALAITGHRPGKIRDVVMSSKDGELLLEYIIKLQNNWNELKEWLLCMQEVSHLDLKCLQSVLFKMQELEGNK
jgi:hypothetical protein